jgi:PEP-CTERM motif
VRSPVPIVLTVLVMAVDSFASATHVLKASAVPEPGVFVALGTGLVGLATLVRRHLNQ